MGHHEGPSDDEKIKAAAKMTLDRLARMAEADASGEEPPDFKAIDLGSITQEQVNQMKDEEWEQKSQQEAAESAAAELEHQQAVKEMDAAADMTDLVARAEESAHEASEAAKRAQIYADEKQQMEIARQMMEAEQQAFATAINVGNEKTASLKHEMLVGEEMSDIEMIARENDAAALLKKIEDDKTAVQKFNTAANSRAESGSTVAIDSGPNYSADQEPSVVIGDVETRAAIEASKDTQQRLADIQAEIIDKQARIQYLDRKISAQPDDASSIFQKDMLRNEIADLETAKLSLIELAAATQEQEVELPATETSRDEIADALNEADYEANIKDKDHRFTAEEDEFFRQGDQLSASTEHRISKLQADMEEVNRQYNALQNQATKKKGFFGGLWSGVKNAVGRGDQRQMQKLIQRHDELQAKLNELLPDDVPMEDENSELVKQALAIKARRRTNMVENKKMRRE